MQIKNLLLARSNLKSENVGVISRDSSSKFKFKIALWTIKQCVNRKYLISLSLIKKSINLASLRHHRFINESIYISLFLLFCWVLQELVMGFLKVYRDIFLNIVHDCLVSNPRHHVSDIKIFFS